MKYIVENWFVIVGLIAVLTAGGYAVYVFVKMPSDKQLNKVERMKKMLESNKAMQTLVSGEAGETVEKDM